MVVETAGNRIREAQGMIAAPPRRHPVEPDRRIGRHPRLTGCRRDLVDRRHQADRGGHHPVPGWAGQRASTDRRPHLELEGRWNLVTVAPVSPTAGVTLQVLQVTGLGFTPTRETVQPAPDAFTTTLTANLPMGIHAGQGRGDRNRVAARFITRDATIPNGRQDPCFAGLFKPGQPSSSRRRGCSRPAACRCRRHPVATAPGPNWSCRGPVRRSSSGRRTAPASRGVRVGASARTPPRPLGLVRRSWRVSRRRTFRPPWDRRAASADRRNHTQVARSTNRRYRRVLVSSAGGAARPTRARTRRSRRPACMVSGTSPHLKQFGRTSVR